MYYQLSAVSIKMPLQARIYTATMKTYLIRGRMKMPHHIFFIFKSNLRTLPVQATSTAANLDCLQTHLITFHLYFFKIWSISLKIFNALTPCSTPQRSQYLVSMMVVVKNRVVVLVFKQMFKKNSVCNRLPVPHCNTFSFHSTHFM